MNLLHSTPTVAPMKWFSPTITKPSLLLVSFNAEILNKGPLLTVYRTSQLVCLVCSFVNTTEPNVPDDSLNISGRYKSIISMLDGIDCNLLFSILINRLKSKMNKNR